MLENLISRTPSAYRPWPYVSRPSARWQSITNGGERHHDSTFTPAKVMSATTIGVAIFLVFGPFFHLMPSSSSLARHASPSCFIARDGGPLQPGGMLRLLTGIDACAFSFAWCFFFFFASAFPVETRSASATSA